MHGVIPTLENLGRNRTPRNLSPLEVAGLEENARLVARTYWATKGQRTAQSVQNQLNLGRWFYIGQAPYAENVLSEIEADSGMALAYYP